VVFVDLFPLPAASGSTDPSFSTSTTLCSLSLLKDHRDCLHSDSWNTSLALFPPLELVHHLVRIIILGISFLPSLEADHLSPVDGLETQSKGCLAIECARPSLFQMEIRKKLLDLSASFHGVARIGKI
jgi:hypothetical protein